MRRYRNAIEFFILFLPIVFLVHNGKSTLNFDQSRRSASNGYIQDSARIQITLKGTRSVLPTKIEQRFLEHVLFGYLNKALTPLSLQIQVVEIDDSRTRVKDGQAASSFTVISHTSVADRKNEEEADMNGAVIERELQSPNEACTNTNKLFLEVTVSGRDYSMLQGNFKTRVEQAINAGNTRSRVLIELFVAPAEAEEYFRDVCSITAVVIPNLSRHHDATKGEEITKTHPDRRDPAELFQDATKDDVDDENTGTSILHNSTDNTDGEEEIQDDKVHPMNTKAVRFRTISGSIFISLCLTAILSNAIRILGKQREIRKQRMAKAKQAYEVPKQAELRRKTSEKFVGMLDNGAVPTR